ncbi:MAG: hypothetical protein ACR2NP_19840 [Pirellulaceae bacterium]
MRTNLNSMHSWRALSPFRLVALTGVLSVVAGLAVALPHVIQEEATTQQAEENQQATDSDAWQAFDARVQADLQAGIAGDDAALVRIIEQCEAELAAGPDHALAMVIKGVAIVFQSGKKFEAGNFQEGMPLWASGLEMLDRAVAAAPESPRVRLYRGEALIGVWVHDPQNRKRLAGHAARDLDFVYSRAPALWKSLSESRQHKLIAGMPAAFAEIGDEAAATRYRQLAETTTGDSANDQTQPTTPGKLPRSSSTDQERFDLLVRDDFFAGMAGDRERYQKAMNVCEERLATNPQHAGAMSFHGWGLLIAAQWKTEEEKHEEADQLRQKGMQEINMAATLEPDSVGPLLVRGSILMGLTTNPEMPPAERDSLLALSTYDFETVYRLQLEQGYFQFLSEHARGELLFGLADAWHRRGNMEKAKGYYQMVVDQIPHSDYGNDSRMMLSGKLDPALLKTRNCTGCH